jgi:signal transduction histidine kinase
MIRTLFLILTLILLQNGVCFAANIPVYNINNSDIQESNFTVGVYVDSCNNKGIDDILLLYEQFKNRRSRYTIKSINNTYWFVFELTNTTSERVERIVGFDEVFLDKVDIYYKEDSVWQTESNGVSVPLAKREVRNQCPNFEIAFNPHESKTIYIKVKSRFALTLGITVLPKNDFLKRVQNRTVGYWSFLGSASIMLIFSILLLLYFRERIYLYYILDIVCFSLFIILYSGFFLHISSSTQLYYSLHASISMVGVFIALFSTNLLGFKKHVKWIHYSLIGIASIYLMLALLIAIDILYYQYMVVFALPSMIFILFAGLYSLSSKNRLARFYIIGLGAYQLGLFTIAIYNLGLLPYSFITRYGFIIGAFTQMIMFLVALGFRLNFLQKEKSRMQEKILISEISKNEELELKVKQRTNELVEMNNHLNSLSKFKEDMTGMIVHDLKNPLNAIINVLPEDKTDPALRTIEQSSFTMMNLVNNILDVYKADSSKLKLNRAQHLITNIVKSAYSDVQYLAQQKGISFEFVGNSGYSVKADTDILIRVVINLFTNAIKASPTGKKIVVEFRYDNGNITVLISNQGKGIPKTRQQEIFEKYKQFNNSESKRSSTGLGLAFCKMAIEAHDGKIGVKSNSSSGATFWFSLPYVTYYEVKNVKSISAVTEPLTLTDNEKEYLYPFITELKKADIYDVWTINRIVKNIEPKSRGIKLWLNRLDDAIYTSNNNLYSTLLIIK